jgi:hypothetical protein
MQNKGDPETASKQKQGRKITRKINTDEDEDEIEPKT